MNTQSKSIDKEVLEITGNVFLSGGMVDGYSVVQNSDQLFYPSQMTPHAHTTIKMMCNSFNNTYHKGYNPDAMEELYKALEAFIDGKDREFEVLAKKAKEALKNAKTTN